jgi:hypothetical protein
MIDEGMKKAIELFKIAEERNKLFEMEEEIKRYRMTPEGILEAQINGITDDTTAEEIKNIFLTILDILKSKRGNEPTRYEIMNAPMRF